MTPPSAPRLFANEAVKWLFYSNTFCPEKVQAKC